MIDLTDLIIIAVYMVAMVTVGLYYSGKNKTTDDYFVGGRRTPGWIAGLSMVGTLISSITFLAYPADAFKTTWVRMLPNILMPVCVIIGVYLFLPFYRQSGTTSAYQYIERRFGVISSTFFSLSFILGQVVRISIVLFLMVLLMMELTQWNYIVCILIAGGIAGLYTIIGGYDASVITDVIQMVILVIGAFAILGVIVYLLPGGMEQIISVGMADGKFDLADLENGVMTPLGWGVSLSDKTVLMLLVLGITSWMAMYGSDQTMVQRYCSARTNREARNAMYICGFSSVPIWAFFMFIGTALYVFFKEFPSPESVDMLTGVRSAEGILPYFIMHHIPSGVKGIVLAAVLSAAMGTISSGINAISSVAIVNIYRRIFVRNKDDRHYLSLAYVFSSLAAVVMMVGAGILVKTETKTLQDAVMIVTAVVAGGGFGIFFVGFVTTKGNDIAVACAAAASIFYSVSVAVVGKGFIPGLSIPFDLYYTGLIGNIFTFVIVYLIGCTVKSANHKDLSNLTIWTRTTSEEEEKKK